MPTNKAILHVGLFGGSFDPVHNGHLLVADSVQQQLALDTVVFLPAAQSPFKPRPETTDDDRLEMLARAVEAYPRLRLDARELSRPGPSYTIDTLRELVSEQPQSRFYLMIGMDAWVDFEAWRAWPEILSLCHLIVMTRPGYSTPVMSLEWQQRQVQSIQQIRQFKAGKLCFIAVPPSSAASGKIRERIKKALSVEKDLHKAVSDYIEQKRIYSSEGR